MNETDFVVVRSDSVNRDNTNPDGLHSMVSAVASRILVAKRSVSIIFFFFFAGLRGCVDVSVLPREPNCETSSTFLILYFPLPKKVRIETMKEKKECMQRKLLSFCSFCGCV